MPDRPPAPPAPPRDPLDALLAACGVDAATVRAWLDAQEIDLATLADSIEPEDLVSECASLSRDQAVALVAAARRGAETACPRDAGAARTQPCVIRYVYKSDVVAVNFPCSRDLRSPGPSRS